MTTTDGQSPLALRLAVARELEGVPLDALRDASERLTAAYRLGAPVGGRPLGEPLHRLAYIAARMPATYAATRAVLAELRRCCPHLPARSLLELGAGPATGLWAASEVFPDLRQATHIEADAAMAALGRRLLEDTPVGARIASVWLDRDLADPVDLASHDLVVASYVLGELSTVARDEIVDAAWRAAAAALVVVEPGTPEGARRVIAARARLLGHGATVVAPCPHGRPCPLPDDDWCHFGVRLNRSSVQRRLKRAPLAYEDEKYAYVVVTREPVDGTVARVLRRPEIGSRRVVLRLCADDGVRVAQVTPRARERYRAARKIKWGDQWVLRD